MNVRSAHETEIDQLAKIWYDGWRDAHRQILPAGLARDRTLASFKARLHQALADIRVIGPPGEPVGFSFSKTMSCISFMSWRDHAEQVSPQPWLRTQKRDSQNAV